MTALVISNWPFAKPTSVTDMQLWLSPFETLIDHVLGVSEFGYYVRPVLFICATLCFAGWLHGYLPLSIGFWGSQYENRRGKKQCLYSLYSSYIVDFANI
jgi:hypothetical protein